MNTLGKTFSGKHLTSQLRHTRQRVAVARPQTRRVAAKALDVNILATVAAERAGTVEAPVGAMVGIGVVVSLAFTALIPIVLKPGDDASKKIFDTKQKDPLGGKDKK